MTLKMLELQLRNIAAGYVLAADELAANRLSDCVDTFKAVRYLAYDTEREIEAAHKASMPPAPEPKEEDQPL